MEEQIAEVVRQYGWYAASIGDHQPPFLYTIGLMQTLDHPELIVFGLEPENAHALISQFVRDIRAGRSFAEPGVGEIDVAGNEQSIGFRRVHPTQHALYLGFAMGYCRYVAQQGDLEAMQVFWPDDNGKFPFDVGCDLAVHGLQPRLDIGQTAREVRRWRRQWE